MFSRTLGGFALMACAALPQMLLAQQTDTLRLADVYRELHAQNPRLKAAGDLVDMEGTFHETADLGTTTRGNRARNSMAARAQNAAGMYLFSRA